MPPDNVKAAQEAEAQSRALQRGTANPEAVGAPVADDPSPQNQPAAAATPAPVVAAEPAAPQRPTLRKDATRDDIAARFRAKRQTSEAAEDAQELRDFTNNGLPPELAPQQPQQQHTIDADKIAAANEGAAVEEQPVEDTEQAIDPDQPAAPVQTVVKRQLKVRGQTIELSDEELVAAAQRGLAGDSYMDEARRTLDEVKALRSTTAAPGSQQQNTPAATSGQPAEQPADTTGQDEQPDPELVQVIEQVQFGDPAQAARALGDVINKRVSQASGVHSQAAVQNERIRNESERSARFLQEFEGQFPDLAQDEFASAAMEKHLYRLQREDLVKLARAYGKDESQVPTDPRKIANWHLWYRTQGHDVRDVPNLLKQARDNFIAWRGTAPSSAQPAPRTPAQPSTPQPRVVVNREVRREAIPQQPTRTVTPRPDSQANPPQPRDRAAIVRDMIAQRAKPRRIAGLA
jgi:hypothetical protein